MSTQVKLVGKYQLCERLGRGGMAEVWKALDTHLQRHVAIKFLRADLQTDPDFITRFEREAQVLASLRHPNIVPIYDFCASSLTEVDKEEVEDAYDNQAYMVMAYIEGPTLANYVRKTSYIKQFPPPVDIVHLFMAISSAIDYAHQHGMIHRDIKPGNILLDKHDTAHNPMGEPILSDFGIAKIMSSSTNTVTHWLGTPYYISPEQAMYYPGNELSDIYSLGVILYQVCTGALPFSGENTSSIIMHHINTMPPPPASLNPDIPLAVSQVILRCLAKDPAERFPTASAMAIALAAAFNLPGYEIHRQFTVSSSTSGGPTIPHLASISGQYGSDIPSHPAEELSIGNLPTFSSSSGRLSSSILQNTPQRPPLESQGDEVKIHSPARPVTSGLLPPTAESSSPPLMSPPLSPHVRQLFIAGKQHRRLLLRLLILFVLVGSVLGTFLLLLADQGTTTSGQVTPNSIVGHVYFESSGQWNENGNQGLNDQILIDLHNISDPPAGKSLYAWLLADRSQSEAPVVLLGKLPLNHGTVHFSYAGDQQHNNLLLVTSRFLITEEDANTTPLVPSYNASRYYAEIPQTNVLYHLRHLLADSPEMTVRNLHGGLGIWLVQNTLKILEWSNSARGDWSNQDAPSIHRHLIRILDYLDGITLIQKDLPPGTPLLVNQHDAQIPLLGIDPHDKQPAGYLYPHGNPPGYLLLIGRHLNGLAQSRGVTDNDRRLVTQIEQTINTVRALFDKIYQDAKQLVAMTDTQLLQPSSMALLNDMVVQAGYAYYGQNAPSTDVVQNGVLQMLIQMQRIATFDVQPYTSKT